MTYQPVDVDLSGRVGVVTGANSGMGKETARELARLGAEVILACRSTDRGGAAAQEIIASTGRTGVSTMALDLSPVPSVRAFGVACEQRFPHLDVLVHNAAASLRTRQITPRASSGSGDQRARPHLLTRLLLPALQASGRGRILTVSTVAAGGLDLTDTQYERRPYRRVAVYRATKQAGRMLTWDLADRLRSTPVTANALGPGYVLTDLTKKRRRAGQDRRRTDRLLRRDPLGRSRHRHLAGREPGRGVDQRHVLEETPRGGLPLPGSPPQSNSCAPSWNSSSAGAHPRGIPARTKEPEHRRRMIHGCVLFGLVASDKPPSSGFRPGV